MLPAFPPPCQPSVRCRVSGSKHLLSVNAVRYFVYLLLWSVPSSGGPSLRLFFAECLLAGPALKTFPFDVQADATPGPVYLFFLCLERSPLFLSSFRPFSSTYLVSRGGRYFPLSTFLSKLLIIGSPPKSHIETDPPEPGSALIWPSPATELSRLRRSLHFPLFHFRAPFPFLFSSAFRKLHRCLP